MILQFYRNVLLIYSHLKEWITSNYYELGVFIHLNLSIFIRHMNKNADNNVTGGGFPALLTVTFFCFSETRRQT